MSWCPPQGSRGGPCIVPWAKCGSIRGLGRGAVLSRGAAEASKEKVIEKWHAW